MLRSQIETVELNLLLIAVQSVLHSLSLSLSIPV